MRHVARSLFTVLALLLSLTVSSLGGGQTPRQTGASTLPATPASASVYFTANDALEVMSYSVADLSDDGRWLAVTASSRRDTYGTDFRRDGDPTYVRVPLARVLVIDTQSGAAQPVFPDKRSVRGLRWWMPRSRGSP